MVVLCPPAYHVGGLFAHYLLTVPQKYHSIHVKGGNVEDLINEKYASHESDFIERYDTYLHEDLHSTDNSDAKPEGEVPSAPAQHPEHEDSNDVNGTPGEQDAVSPFI